MGRVWGIIFPMSIGNNYYVFGGLPVKPTRMASADFYQPIPTPRDAGKHKGRLTDLPG